MSRDILSDVLYFFEVFYLFTKFIVFKKILLKFSSYVPINNVGVPIYRELQIIFQGGSAMSVNGLGNYNYVNYASKAETEAKQKAKTESAKADSAKAEAADKTEEEKAASQAPKKAETYKPDMSKINEMKADMNKNMGSFKQMVYSMFKAQGGKADSALGKLLNITGETQAEAQAAISEDGEWGVNATANRILDFAKALAGGDPEKIGVLKDAVQKGFAAAEKIWGGKLPDISYQTLDKVMQGFDDWAKNGSGDYSDAVSSK